MAGLSALVGDAARSAARTLRAGLTLGAALESIVGTFETAARLAEADLGREALKELERATDDMEQALAAGDLEGWAEADSRFHEKLIELYGNQRILAFFRTICDQAHRARMMTLRLRKKPVRSTAEHRQIMNCILQGKAQEVRETFRKHREHVSQELLEILEITRLSRI